MSHDIRSLRADEVALILPLARQFHAEFLHGHLNHAPLNEAHFVNVLTQHVDAGRGFVFVLGSPIRGMISGLMFNDMSTGELCCMEFFWYMSPTERGTAGVRLLAAWEKEAQSRGAIRLLMAHLVGDHTEKFSRFYEKRGYRLKEQIFYRDAGG